VTSARCTSAWHRGSSSIPAVVGSPRLTHHNASMQVFDDGDRGSRVVWIADLLPSEIAGTIAAMIEEGLGAMKKTLER